MTVSRFQSSLQKNAPLAERVRPRTLSDFVGQDHLLGKNNILTNIIENGRLPSLILWGPPGCGKTTLAHILALAVKDRFLFFSAVLSGVKEVRAIVKESREVLESQGQRTILFVDEIHRFNKAQQDAFLPHVESGLLTLIGATTENPSFQVIAPLLSRARVLVLKPLPQDAVITLLKRGITTLKEDLGHTGLTAKEDALKHLAAMADGDARIALNGLEIAAALAKSDKKKNPIITVTVAEEAMQQRSLRYDKDGEEHYNLISALHKSVRDSDPDGALYWLVRMLAAGEDPLYAARRLIRMASEDIGNADPQALRVTLDAQLSYQTLGSPEGELALAQAAVYLACAPKSNAVYAAYNKVRREIKRSGALEVPMHIRNAPTKLMKEMGYGKGYIYAHDQEGALVEQDHLPKPLAGRRFYEPTNRGHEALIGQRLKKWRQILRQRKIKR